MPEAPASPLAHRLAPPGWLDRRLVLGVLLVLASIVVGARLTASADTSVPVWAATHDLSAGSSVVAGDLQAVRVRLDSQGKGYVLARGAAPVGYVLQHGIGSGELLPRAALRRPGEDGRELRDVAVPVAAGHLPDDLSAGQQVDVYVTPGTADSTGTSGTGAAPVTTRVVLRRVPVALRPRSSSLASAGGATSGVVLQVDDVDAATLVSALREGRIDLVRVPAGHDLPALAAG